MALIVSSPLVASAFVTAPAPVPRALARADVKMAFVDTL